MSLQVLWTANGTPPYFPGPEDLFPAPQVQPKRLPPTHLALVAGARLLSSSSTVLVLDPPVLYVPLVPRPIPACPRPDPSPSPYPFSLFLCPLVACHKEHGRDARPLATLESINRLRAIISLKSSRLVRAVAVNPLPALFAPSGRRVGSSGCQSSIGLVSSSTSQSRLLDLLGRFGSTLLTWELPPCSKHAELRSDPSVLALGLATQPSPTQPSPSPSPN